VGNYLVNFTLEFYYQLRWRRGRFGTRIISTLRREFKSLKNVARLRSLTSHTIFGVGMYAAALVSALRTL
jgi:hypothetical protein